ncbi:hypothetical protein SPV_2496 [Streptococcus pneumoniae]|nr:hypothetical protein SPV_2496 [Streptococcus pneumoniae]
MRAWPEIGWYRG